MPKFEIDYVAFDGILLVTERWVATKCHCPRCGHGGEQPYVWRLHNEKQQNLSVTAKCGNHDLHLFICISCGLTGRGWEGFKPSFSVQDRAAQIIKLAFEGQ